MSLNGTNDLTQRYEFFLCCGRMPVPPRGAGQTGCGVRVKAELGVTVSIDVSWNKIFAKLGSDYKKPDAITVFHHENYRNLIWPLPVGDLLHVSPSTERKLRNMAIFTKGVCWCYNGMNDRWQNHSYADTVGRRPQVCSRSGAGCPSGGFAQSRWSGNSIYNPRPGKGDISIPGAVPVV